MCLSFIQGVTKIQFRLINWYKIGLACFSISVEFSLFFWQHTSKSEHTFKPVLPSNHSSSNHSFSPQVLCNLLFLMPILLWPQDSFEVCQCLSLSNFFLSIFRSTFWEAPVRHQNSISNPLPSGRGRRKDAVGGLEPPWSIARQGSKRRSELPVGVGPCGHPLDSPGVEYVMICGFGWIVEQTSSSNII